MSLQTRFLYQSLYVTGICLLVYFTHWWFWFTQICWVSFIGASATSRLTAPKFGAMQILALVLISSGVGILSIILLQIPEHQLMALLRNPIFMLLVWLTLECSTLMGYFRLKNRLSKLTTDLS